MKPVVLTEQENVCCVEVYKEIIDKVRKEYNFRADRLNGYNINK